MNKEEKIKIELEQTKNNLSKNFDKLPEEELPFMEPHLRSLYYQIYYLLAYGFYNASIVLVGIFLESITKEILFINGVTDAELESMEFGPAILECKKRNLLLPEEIIFLFDKKDKIRNPYLHNNQINLTKGKYFDIYKISKPVERLINLDKMVKDGKLTEQQARGELISGLNPEQRDSTSLRPLAQVARTQEEEKKAFSIFLDVDKFIRKLAIKYFKTG